MINKNIVDKDGFLDTEKFGEDDEILISGELNVVVEDYLSQIYQRRVLKRFIYRPYLGRWYPFIDLVSLGLPQQLSFFYDSVSITFSGDKLCCLCYNTLKRDFIVGKSIQRVNIGLCEDCAKKVYYGYWDCLNKIYQQQCSSSIPSLNPGIPYEQNGLKGDYNCTDLLSPSCGFPIDSERVNPCLKNHAIGIVFKDFNKIEILIGTVETIKYQMIMCGGIFGLILGYQNRIINLELMKEIYPALFALIREFSEIWNSGINFEDDNSQDYTEKLTILEKPIKMEMLNGMLTYWIVLNYLNYYNKYHISKLVKMLTEAPFKILKHLVKFLLIEKKYDIKVLSFLELYKLFPPITKKFRKMLEKMLTKSGYIEKGVDFFKNLTGDNLEHNNQDNEIINWSDLQFISRQFGSLTEFHVSEVLSCYGKYLIVESNISEKPVILLMDDLLGRRIY
jgi:hypothetical protein